MTHDELKKLLKTLNMPLAYHHFLEPLMKKPYITFFREDDEPIQADNRVYAKWQNYRVELHIDKKDPKIEARLTGLFDDNNICYEVDEDYITGEKQYVIAYYISISGG